MMLEAVLAADTLAVSFKYRRNAAAEWRDEISFTRGLARIACVVLGFLFILGGLGTLLVSSTIGGGLILFGFIMLLIGRVLRAPQVVTPLTQVNVYQQAAPPMMYASPAQQTYVHERETVKVRCRNCGSLNFETSGTCASCGAPM